MNQNTEKSPGDLRRLAITQTPMKDHQLTPVEKTWDYNNNDNNSLKIVEEHGLDLLSLSLQCKSLVITGVNPQLLK